MNWGIVLGSQQDATGTRNQLSLAAIQAMCEQTTRDIAEEENAEYVGIEYDECLSIIANGLN